MEKEEILKKANLIINETKNEQDKYHEERMLIYSLLQDSKNKENLKYLEILERVIRIFEKNRNLESENKQYRKLELKQLEDDIKNQKIRKEDGVAGRLLLFEIKDNDGKKYSFFTRPNAQTYIDKNSNIFDKDAPIGIIVNENMDLEKLITKIIENNK